MPRSIGGGRDQRPAAPAGLGILLQRDYQSRFLDPVAALRAGPRPARPAAAEEPLSQDVLDPTAAGHRGVIAGHSPRGHITGPVHELDVVEAVRPRRLDDLVGPGF